MAGYGSSRPRWRYSERIALSGLSSAAINGLPGGYDQYEAVFEWLRLGSTSHEFAVRVGTESGLQSTGYQSNSSTFDNNSSSTTSFRVRYRLTDAGSGRMKLQRLPNGLWLSEHIMSRHSSVACHGAGEVQLTGTLGSIGIFTTAGNFQGGHFSVRYWA